MDPLGYLDLFKTGRLYHITIILLYVYHTHATLFSSRSKKSILGTVTNPPLTSHLLSGVILQDEEFLGISPLAGVVPLSNRLNGF